MRHNFLRIVCLTALLNAVIWAAGCSEPTASEPRPKLLSAETARIENLSALDQMGIELGRPMPARYMEPERCIPGELTCLPHWNADRID